MLTPKQLRRAATVQERIESLQKELGRILGTSGQTVTAVAPRKRWKLSAAAKARIAAAARARWARVKGEKLSAKPAGKARAKMSAAAKARLSAKLKAIWAARKAAKK